MDDLIAGHVAGDVDKPWSDLMASFGRTVITVRCLTERQFPYVDTHGEAEELNVPKGSTVTLYCNADGRHTFQELRRMVGKSRHPLLGITIGSRQVTLFNDGTLQGRNPTPQDVRQRSLAGAAV